MSQISKDIHLHISKKFHLHTTSYRLGSWNRFSYCDQLVKVKKETYSSNLELTYLTF